MRRLSIKQKRFVREYRKDMNATKAAVRAGYSPRTAKQQGHRLLTNADLAAAIMRENQLAMEKADLQTVDVLRQVAALASTDARTFFDGGGNLKPPSQWTEAQGAQVASFEVIKKNAAAGDGHTDMIHKIKFWDKCKAHSLAMQHLGLLIQHVQADLSVSYSWEGDDELPDAVDVTPEPDSPDPVDGGPLQSEG